MLACLPAIGTITVSSFFLADYFYKSVVLATLNKQVTLGRQHLPKVPAIFVANHQSSLDIPVVGALCNKVPHVWLVLEYYLKTPIIGFFIRRMFISVDQSNPAKAARSLIQVYKFVNGKNRHLLIFPEGGRFKEINTFLRALLSLHEGREGPLFPSTCPIMRAYFRRIAFLFTPILW